MGGRVKLRSLSEEVVWSLEGPSTPCSEGLHHQGVQQHQQSVNVSLDYALLKGKERVGLKPGPPPGGRRGSLNFY